MERNRLSYIFWNLAVNSYRKIRKLQTISNPIGFGMNPCDLRPHFKLYIEWLDILKGDAFRKIHALRIDYIVNIRRIMEDSLVLHWT